MKIGDIIERNHQNEITIIMEQKESYQIDTQMTATITWEKGVVTILTLTERNFNAEIHELPVFEKTIQTPLKSNHGENQEQTSQTTSTVAIVSHQCYGLYNG